MTGHSVTTLATNVLISKSLAGHALRSFGRAGDGLVSIYLHRSGGRISIGGGSYGAQWIDSLEIDADLQTWFEELIIELDDILDLDFRFVSDRGSSNLDLYIDTEISVGPSGKVLGLAIPNSTRSRSWWEIVINGPSILADADYTRFAIAHELGHALGLEHPFDASDGDSVGAAFADPDTSVTLMSYTRASNGWPVWFQPADLTAMVSLWGLEDDEGSRAWLLQAPDGSLLSLDTQMALHYLALADGHQLLGATPDGWISNARPVPRDDHFSLLEDSDLSVSLDALLSNDSDPDGDVLDVISVAGVPVGALPVSIDLAGAALVIDRATGIRLVPRHNWHGLLAVPYVVSDGSVQSEAHIHFEVLPVNDAPAFSGPLPSLNVTQDVPFVERLPLGLADDVDGDALSFSLQYVDDAGVQALPEWLVFDTDQGLLTGLVPKDWAHSQAHFLVAATDEQGLSATSPLLLLIAPALSPEPLPPAALVHPLPSLPTAPIAPTAPAVVDPPVAVDPAPPPKHEVFGAPTTPLPSMATSVRLIRSAHAAVSPGTIGFGADRPTRFVAQSRADSPSLPSVLVGGANRDRYVIAPGGFTVIADGTSPRLLSGRRDLVTGFDGIPADWSAQKLGANDLLLRHVTPRGKHGNHSPTVVLLVDPFGRLDPSHKLEALGFTGGGRRFRDVPLKQAHRQFDRGEPIDYQGLPLALSDGLGAVLGQPGQVDSLHTLIAALRPEALSSF